MLIHQYLLTEKNIDYLSYEVAYNNYEVIKYLIKNTDFYDKELLSMACHYGHFNIIKYLSIYLKKDDILDRYIIPVCNRYHKSIISCEQFNIIKYLINIAKSIKLLDMKHVLNSSLIRICKNCNYCHKNLCEHFNIVKFLIKEFKSFDDIEFDKILYNACESRNLNTVNYLINLKISKSQINLLNTLLIVSRFGYFNIIKYLFEEIGLHLLGNYTDKILFTACKYNHINIVKYFIENGFKSFWQPNTVHTALKHAFDNQNHNIVKYLVEKR